MIALDGKISLEMIKKSQFFGSDGKMRYLLDSEDGQIRATSYPQPWCFDKTPDEDKESSLFEFSMEGLSAAIGWLNKTHDEKFV